MQQAPQPPSPTQGLTFGPEDMDALRHGKLTETVKQQLRPYQGRMMMAQFKRYLPFLGIAIVIVIVLTVLDLSTEAKQVPLLLFILCGALSGMFLAIAVLIFYIKLLFQRRLFDQDLHAGISESISGKTHLYTESNDRNKQQYIEVGGLRLPVTPWFYDLKEPDAAHRVYFLPKSKLLITAERVGDVL
jgi:hypothetical protein